MRDKMAISAYILKIVEKDPLRAKEGFNRHQLFPQISKTNKINSHKLLYGKSFVKITKQKEGA